MPQTEGRLTIGLQGVNLPHKTLTVYIEPLDPSRGLIAAARRFRGCKP
jgi:hypothetical protein